MEIRPALGRLVRRLGLRAGALDYDPAFSPVSDSPLPDAFPEAGAAQEETVGEEAVDVVVPVHGAHELAERCLASLFRHSDFRRHRLVVVVDGDPAFRAAEALASAGRRETDDVVLLESLERRGYVVSANRGLEHSFRDVVLLNSDTVVTRSWLEKLRAAAYSAPEIATVTPFSNNATICSLPRPLRSNELPAGYDVDRFGELVERAAERRRPRIPSGVGMCLYVKRAAIRAVGTFDAEAFGEGYGEEMDFCLRALAAGWVHVLDDATFVFHEGQGSFGASRPARMRTAERTLRRRHPEYVATIAAFLDADPLRPARERVLAALRRPRQARRAPRVLHVVHGWPPRHVGGSELYAYWLASWQKERGPVAAFARVADPERRLGEATEIEDSGLRVRLTVNNFTQRDPLSRNALADRRLERDFLRFARDFRPELIHVHHLSGHGLGLMRRAADLRVPIVYQVQDWWPLCARANLLRPDRTLCPGPSPARCSACLPLTGLPPKGLLNRALYRYRARLARRSLRRADVFVMGSRAIERDYRRAGWLRPRDLVHVVPYGVELPAVKRPGREARRPLRFGYVGTLMPHKGVHVAVEAFAGLSAERAVLDLWGDPLASPAYTAELRAAAGEAVRFQGAFAEAERSAILEQLDVLVVPSIGLESYGLVAREAMAHGVPVLASRRGALEELFEPEGTGGGALVEPEDPKAWRRWIDRLVAEPEIVSRWAREIPRVVGLEEHARRVAELYDEVLDRWSEAGWSEAGRSEARWSEAR